MAVACALGILLMDQWSKKAVESSGNFGWGNVVRFKFVSHRHKSYETAGARTSLVIVWILALASVVILNRFGAWFQSAMSLAGLGLALGGAASNLLDILRRRYVIDYIDLGWWSVFNLADVAILGGLAAAFLG